MRRAKSYLLLRRLFSKLAVKALLFMLVSITSGVASGQITENWVARYDPGDGYQSVFALVVDAAGNAYVAGSSTIKYDTDGNLLWVGRGGVAIALNAAGDVYVAGDTTTKYDSDGNELWVATLGGVAIAVDTAGNVYVTGGASTVKYDTNGNELWVAARGGVAIALNAAGDVYVAGTSTGLGGRVGYATTKYDTNGIELWAATYSLSERNFPSAIAVDTVGNAYVTGSTVGYDTLWGDFYSNFLTVKYDANGNELWNYTYYHPSTVYRPQEGAFALSLGTSGNAFVTGRIEDSDTSHDYATINYDAYGSVVWVARYNGPGNGYDSARAIAVDAAGNIYVAGHSAGDYATIKYDTNGNELWVHRYNGPGNGWDEAKAIALNAAGDVYVTGESADADGIYGIATIKLTSSDNGSRAGGSSSNGGGGGGCFIEAASER